VNNNYVVDTIGYNKLSIETIDGSFIEIQFLLKPIVSGIENIPTDRKVLMVSNHISSFDPLASLAIIKENTTFVAKAEIEKYFLIGNIVKAIEGLFLERENLKQSLKVMMGVQSSLSKQDKNWIIYPEGTRNTDDLMNLKEFHSGTFRPAIKAGVDIVPIAIYGTQRILKFKPELKKYPIHISFLPPIKASDIKEMSTEDVAELARKQIQRELSFNIRRKDHEFNLKYNKKKYRFNQIF
jgi:1-acyl-sn-glycerol-3-phosphate acyltransferase